MTETTADLIKSGTNITEVLTDTERTNLSQCEQVIEKGLNTFLEVGKALADIRDNRLYRESHKTFEKYCKEVWDLGKSYATRQICGYETVTLLESKMVPIGTKNDFRPESEADQIEEKCTDCPHRKALANKNKGVKIPNEYGKCTRPEGLCEKHTDHELPEKFVHPNHQEIILPINEAQTRPLTKLSPDDKVKAWGLVLNWSNEGKKLTSGLVGKAVKQVKGEVTEKKRKKNLKKLDATERVSNLFKRECKIMEEIINDERNSGWKTTSKKEAVKWLNFLVTLAQSED